jgi:hypothetical protein
MRDRMLALLAMLALAGCAAAPEPPGPGASEGTAPAPPALDPATEGQVEEADDAVPPAAPLALSRCQFTQAEFPADPRDFDGLPPNVTLATGPGGLARIVAVAAACGPAQPGGEPQELLWAAVLVDPGAGLRRDGAGHGILLSLWADDQGVADRLASLGAPAVTTRPLALAATWTAAAAEARATAEPDFLLTVAAAGGPAPAPHATVRLLAFEDGRVRCALDMERGQAPAASGPATASFVVDRLYDLPDHRAGVGEVGPEGGVAFAYAACPEPSPQGINNGAE